MGKVVSAHAVTGAGSEPLPDLESVLTRSHNQHIELSYDYSQAMIPPAPSGAGSMWRYSNLLPLDPGPISYPLKVGGTPLVASPRLRQELGLAKLWLKDETRGPTGSNKDRATALVVEHALRRGADAVTCASTGNVAASLSVGAAAAGIKAFIFVPEHVEDTKLRLMLFAGATVFKVQAGYTRAFALSREAACEFGWTDRNTGVNPLTIEAKKTVAFEIWEDLNGEVPDIVVAPVGDGPTLAALVKGFRELMACGATDRVPRMIGVQAEGCQPITKAWLTGSPIVEVQPNTIADGIAVGAPVSAWAVLRDVRDTGGAMVAVSDDAILGAVSMLGRFAGLIAEPAGASATAGLITAAGEGLVKPDETVVVLVTGSGLKTPGYLRQTGTAAAIEGRLEEVEALARSA